MEIRTEQKLMLTKTDYEELNNYLQTCVQELQYDRAQAEKLKEDLQEADIVSRSEFPRDMVTLNSRVTIRNTVARQNFTYTLVLPGKPDFRNDHISVLSPLGRALLGTRKGDTISLPNTRGKKYYSILEVLTPAG